jgi:uncharacterized membrane protein YhiD involved in acid resistance
VTLAVGLASGVGLWMLAAFATVFILVVLWIVESFEPTATQTFTLKVGAKDPDALKPQIEQLLARYRFGYELRSVSTEELHYEVRVPVARRTDRLSKISLKLHSDNVTAVEWEEEKKEKKK